MTQSGGLQSEISLAFSMCRRAFVGVALFTGMSNILMLSGSMFMLEIYDRVLPSRSVPTLVGLAALVLVLYAFQAGLEMVRARIMGRVGLALDEALGERVYDAIIRFPLKAAGSGSAGLQPLRDLDQVRAFMSGSGPTALFDLPWIPLYLGLCFAFHFWLGTTALVGTIALVGITALTEAKTRSPSRKPLTSRRRATRSRKRGAGTPRCCERWAWEVGSPPGGPSQIANACPDPRALATSPVTLEPSPRWRAWRCNPWSSVLAHIW